MRFAYLIAAFGMALFSAACIAQEGQTNAEDQMTNEDASFVYVEMTTNKGPILLELDKENAPLTVANFVEYVEDGHYDGTVFHRVISNFMIQGGGFDIEGNRREVRGGVKNEWQNGLKNTKYTIAMARLGGQADSGTDQFFINVADNGFLDQPRDGAGYAVFGKVVAGESTVDAIKGVRTANRGDMGDWPVENVVIEKAEVSSADRKDAINAAAKEAMREEIEAAEKAFAERLGALVQTIDQAAWAAGLEEAQGFLTNELGLDVSKGVFNEETGLWTLDTVEGSGESPAITDTVEVLYTGWLTNGTKFDSAHDRNQSIEFPLTGVIPGWGQTVKEMKPGGTRYVVIPSALGYGSRGAGGVIPPNATLIFHIDLVD